MVTSGLAASAAPAVAYEFQVHARTIGQFHQLRSFRLVSGDPGLGRQRLTEILSLDIWDIGERRGRAARPARGGPRLSFSSYLRIDHDLGSWTRGDIYFRDRDQRFAAHRLIPELDDAHANLELLYAYLAAESLLDGRLDLYLGRQLNIETLDWWSMDGLTARVNTPWHLAVEAFAGLRVRDASLLGSSVQEPDGTASSECSEYVEDETPPGSSGWRRLDRRDDANPFADDFGLCPQRTELMPTFGAAVALTGLRWLSARIGYRRSQSPTPALIGARDRLDTGLPDLGYFPDELGQAPSWGVNEERLAASARGNLPLASGRAQLSPYAGVRYSLLHGLVDEGHLGLAARYLGHRLEPELYYSAPTFDGDSVFNVFSSEPYVDVRLTYGIAPPAASWQAYVRGWGRRYVTPDGGLQPPDADVETSELAGGAQLGARVAPSAAGDLQLDLFHEGGYGGRRTGLAAATGWRPVAPLWLRARLSAIDFTEDIRPELDGTSFGVSAVASYQLGRHAVFHLRAEENSNRFDRSQFRLLGVIDLSYQVGS
jgi:hypothetical protein